MEPALTDGADLMDCGPTSILPAGTSPNLPSFPPTAEYSAIDWSGFLERHELPTYESFQSYPFIELDNPASSQGMANLLDFQNATMYGSTHDNTFGNPAYGNPSPALSVGSRHLSIGSGASSNHSWSSWRGRSRIKKIFSRGSSIAGRAKSAMEEGMSSWSLSGAKKHVSPSPRRTGKLTDVARAGMRLLKGQGACWKCKILKKSVRKTALDVSLSG
jgi:hypothetical protein